MASTEEQVFLGSRNLSYHSAHYPDASADWDYPEDPGDRREGVEVAELHDQPARMSTSDSDPCEVARRALDLMFPREEDSDDCWSTWSAREKGSDDDDEQGGDEGDGSTQESSDYEDDGRNCQVILAETNCPGKLLILSTDETKILLYIYLLSCSTSILQESSTPRAKQRP